MWKMDVKMAEDVGDTQQVHGVEETDPGHG